MAFWRWKPVTNRRRKPVYSVGNVIDADDAAPFVFARVRLHDGQVDQDDPVVFVVVGEQREHRLLVLHPAVEHGLISGDQLVELARSVDHMDEAGGANARHRRMFPSYRSAD
jgi:hypothetical protein